MLTKLNELPSAISEERMLGIPFSNRYYGCGFGETETVTHIPFECLWHNEDREKWITPFMQQWNDSPPDILVTKFLIDSRLENIILLACCCCSSGHENGL